MHCCSPSCTRPSSICMMSQMTCTRHQGWMWCAYACGVSSYWLLHRRMVRCPKFLLLHIAGHLHLPSRQRCFGHGNCCVCKWILGKGCPGTTMHNLIRKKWLWSVHGRTSSNVLLSNAHASCCTVLAARALVPGFVSCRV